MKKIFTILIFAVLLTSTVGYSKTSTKIISENSISVLSDENGDILYVGGTGPDNYTKIQDAIDNTSDGDTVFVYQGTYYEDLIVNNSIFLIGENKYTTVINAGGIAGDEDVINVTADEVSITGFSLTECGWDADKAAVKLQSKNNCIYENIFRDNEKGIYLIDSSNTTAYNNEFYAYSGQCIVLKNSSEITITKNYMGLSSNSLALYHSNNNTITENKMSYAFHGIDLENSCNNLINNNNISNIGSMAILIWPNNNNNTISQNTIIRGGSYGIFIQDSSNTKILQNSVTNCERAGISVNGQSIIVSGNFIADNGIYGITILHTSNNVTISDNIIDNSNIGIQMSSSSNLIINNTLTGHYDTGIGIHSCENNKVYHNNFINNGVNADCVNSITIWDDGVFGNYWDDYAGRDVLGDGIGDTPHAIEGDANQDRFPLMVPYGPGPGVKIQTPKGGFLYIRSIKFPYLLDIFKDPPTMVLGNIKILASAANYNEGQEIDRVEFYVDDILRKIDTKPPYSWRWRLSSPIRHRHTIKAVAYDTTGASIDDNIKVWRFF